MYRKILIQLLLLVLLLATIIFIFNLYFQKKDILKKTNLKIEDISNAEINIDDKTANVMKDINYSFSDVKGNNYLLISKFGKIDINNSNKIFMTDVIATIYLVNSSPIIIVSKYANYNKSDHETNFFEDVKLTYEEHKTFSQNLDLSFKNNIALMYNNIIYNKPGTELFADRLEIDLLTKNSKIFMDNNSEKIKIINKD